MVSKLVLRHPAGDHDCSRGEVLISNRVYLENLRANAMKDLIRLSTDDNKLPLPKMTMGENIPFAI